MEQCDFTSALAQVLTKPGLLETFLADPETAADLINMIPGDRALFVSMPCEQIRRQAQLLVTKRMRAVFEQMPLTIKSLGPAAAERFHSFASHSWPQGHRRHSIDALRFCLYLRQHKLPCNQSEYNRIHFHCTGKRVRVCLARDAVVNGNMRYALQVLFRLRGQRAEWRLYLKA